MKFHTSKDNTKKTTKTNTLAALKKEKESFINTAPQQVATSKAKSGLIQFYARFTAEEWELIEKYLIEKNVAFNKFMRFVINSMMKEELFNDMLLSNNITKRTSVKFSEEQINWINEQAALLGEFKYNILRLSVIQFLSKE